MKIFWCNTCEVPIINERQCICGNKTKYMATDIRPVFPEERHLIYIITENKLYLERPVWSLKGFKYLVGGKVETVPISRIIKEFNVEEISAYLNKLDLSRDYDFFNENINSFVESNRRHLNVLEFAAMDYVCKVIEKYPNYVPVVSFSGGKDSTVVSHLVKRALFNPSILHLFGDTTLEYSFTFIKRTSEERRMIFSEVRQAPEKKKALPYLERFQIDNPMTPFIVSRSDHDFMNLCNKMGPPSRIMSWCCTIFKTGPLNTKINNIAKGKKLLTFYGIRGSESVSRNDYQKMIFNDFDKIKTSKSVKNTVIEENSLSFDWSDIEVEISPKIAKQIVTSPIFEWRDIDIWLYIFSNKLDFNNGYRLGFSRIGCWCCPNNSTWSMFLAKVYMPKEYKKWNDYLIDFARQIGKKDAENYVETGKWKARQGGAGLVNKQIHIEAKPCIDEEFARTFNLTRGINDELYEYFKPFGKISNELGRKLLNEVIVLDRNTNKPIIKLQGNKNTYTLKIICVNPTNYRLLSQRIDSQLRKFQACIGCLGCVSKCPKSAISYIGGTYRILQKKCIGCLDCVIPWTGGCLMTKVLAVKKGV